MRCRAKQSEHRREIIPLQRLLGGAPVAAHCAFQLTAAFEVFCENKRLALTPLFQPGARKPMPQHSIGWGQRRVHRLVRVAWRNTYSRSDANRDSPRRVISSRDSNTANHASTEARLARRRAIRNCAEPEDLPNKLPARRTRRASS